MKIEFEVKLQAQDVFGFNMYHSYHRFQIWVFTILGIAVMVLSATTAGKVDFMYTILYFLCGGVFAFYTPFNLRAAAKTAVKEGNPLSHRLHYTFSESGIAVRYAQEEGQEEEVSTAKQSVDWKQIYRIVETKKLILVYTSRVNASILPKEQVGEKLEELKELFKGQVPPHRLKLK